MQGDVGLGRRWRADPMVIAVNALGITQITAWGTSYYCLGVLAKPIVAETGWSISTVFLGFSVALVTMGFISTWVGRLIDRVGARAVMSIGTRHRLGRAARAVAGSRLGDLSGGLGGDRRGHALLPLRRGVRRPGAGGADARPRGHLLPHALRRLRLDGLLGDRPLPERGLWLARHADDLRGASTSPSACRSTGSVSRGASRRRRRRPPRLPRPRRMAPCSRAACASSASFCSPSSCRSTASSSASCRCSSCRCSRRRAWPAPRRCGSPRSRAMASSPAGSSRYSSGATSRR